MIPLASLALFGPYGVPVGVGLPDSVRGYGDSPLLASWRAKVERGEPTTLIERNVAVASLAWSADVLGRLPGTGNPTDPPGSLVDLGARGRGLVLGLGGFEGGDVALPAARPAGAAVPPSSAIDYTVVQGAAREALYRDARLALFGMRLHPENLVAAAPGDRSATLVAPAGYQVLLAVVLLGGMAALAAYSIEVSAQEVEARRDVEIARVQEEGLRDRTAMVLEAKARALAQRLAFAKETGYLPPETSVERQALPEPIRQQVDDWRSKAVGAAMWSGLGVGTAAVAAAAGAWAWDRDEQRKAARGIIRSEIGSLGLRPPELG